jgi:hypothetical protein
MKDSCRSKWIAAPLALALACAEPDATEDEVGASQQDLIRDQSNGGKAGFYWRPQIVSLLSTQPGRGTFEPRLSPLVAIDQVDATGKLVKNVARYNGALPTFGQRILRNLNAEYYVVRFDSKLVKLDAALNYRVSVLPAAGQPELGFADIDVVNNALEYAAALLPTARWNYAPLIKGDTLAIRFRIETQAVDRDGDGVFDWLDNCPDVKNPPLQTAADVVSTRAALDFTDEAPCDAADQPLDPVLPAQPDADGDGVGDACDCPLGSTGTPPDCVNAIKPVTTTCQCASGDTYLTCTDTCGKVPDEQAIVCGELCGGDPGATSCSVEGSAPCDPTAPCPAGYYPGTASPACIDMDECKLDRDGCAANQICANQPGSFVCISCPPGSINDGSDRCTQLPN